MESEASQKEETLQQAVISREEELRKAKKEHQAQIE